MYPPYGPSLRKNFQRVMTVNGEAVVRVAPDTVSMQLEVMTENKILSQAQQENANKMNQVIQALLQAGIPRENIQTSAYDIAPKYDYVEGSQVFRGYEVTNSITVKMKAINQAGRIVDLAVENGVNRVSNFQFSIENKEDVYRRALSNALTDGLAKAQTIANTLNVHLDPAPVKIVEESIEPPHIFHTFAATAESTATPIEPGQIMIRASVEEQFRYLSND